MSGGGHKAGGHKGRKHAAHDEEQRRELDGLRQKLLGAFFDGAHREIDTFKRYRAAMVSAPT